MLFQQHHSSMVLTGRAAPQIGKSLAGLVGAFRYIEFAPASVPYAGWLLLGCGVVVITRYRKDLPLLMLLLLPQLTAIAGYALFLGRLDHYYYLSLMPAEVLTVVFAFTAFHRPGWTRLVGLAFLAAVLVLAPTRILLASTMHRMPQYESS